MAELTKLETKVAEVIGLAMAAQGAAKKVMGKVKNDDELSKTLQTMLDEAAAAEQRATEVVGRMPGKKSAIMSEARTTKKKATDMMSDYLDRGWDALDGFEFLTMAEAGEVGHWAVLEQMNRKARNPELRELVRWQLPIQKRHLRDVQAGATRLAAEEDPAEAA